MGRRIDFQNNGNFAIWSTIVDDYLSIDMTREEVYDFFAEESIEDSKRSVEKMFERSFSNPSRKADEERLDLLREEVE